MTEGERNGPDFRKLTETKTYREGQPPPHYFPITTPVPEENRPSHGFSPIKLGKPILPMIFRFDYPEGTRILT
jgi:hypothetical protein